MDLRWYGYTLMLGGAVMIIVGIVLGIFSTVLFGGGLTILGSVFVNRGNNRER